MASPACLTVRLASDVEHVRRGEEAQSPPLLYEGAVSPEPLPSPDVATQPSSECLTNDLCAFLYERTGLSWLADTGYYALVKPARILLIIAAALVLRYVVRRMIKRVTRGTAVERRRGLFHPLRERMPSSLREATSMRAERRNQRAQALGSVMQSIASVTIFSVAGMMVLGEIGMNLAPLLASAGIAGLALGFGAQNLVKDFIAGLFMLLEDQYGVGDLIDIGDVSGTVEAVGLRITTIRDGRGALWYVRNGEIARVGNRSQGWAVVVLDVPIGFAGVEEATRVLQAAAAALAEDPEFADLMLEPPQVLGVEHISIDGAVIRATAKTTAASQAQVGRELRRRLTGALEAAGITAHLSAGRNYVRPPQPREGATDTVDNGTAGAT
jgi:small-conductance mechanosensitive channel